MDKERFKRRQNPLPEKAAEVEKGLTCIEAAFGRAWLEQGDSPLQRLWRRTDFFATAQLYLLGHAPVTMAAHRPWIRERPRLDRPSNAQQLQGLRCDGDLPR
jgi:hypothetical protein